MQFFSQKFSKPFLIQTKSGIKEPLPISNSPKCKEKSKAEVCTSVPDNQTMTE